MVFEKVYDELLKGKRIRRKEWEQLMYLQIVDGRVKTFKGEYTHFSADADILVSKGWRIVGDEEKKDLTFLEALDALKQKKAVTNSAWDDYNDNSHILIDQGQIAKCRSVGYSFMPTFKCFCANDWEVMK